jgi:hypothetical protein
LSKKLDTNEFGHILVDLAKEYNNAVLIIERNSIGEAVLQSVRSLDYPKLLHSSNDMNSIELAENYASVNIPFGFATHASNRPVIINNLATRLRDGRIKVNSLRLVSELDTFISDETGLKYSAMKGHHDDLILALSLGIYCWEGLGRVLLKNVAIDRAALGGMNKTTDKNTTGTDTRFPIAGRVPQRDRQMNSDPKQYWKMGVGKGETWDLTEL